MLMPSDFPTAYDARARTRRRSSSGPDLQSVVARPEQIGRAAPGIAIGRLEAPAGRQLVLEVHLVAVLSPHLIVAEAAHVRDVDVVTEIRPRLQRGAEQVVARLDDEHVDGQTADQRL